VAGAGVLQLETGLAYGLERIAGECLQALDVSAVTSLAGTGPDWLVRAGVSVRFGR